MASSISRRLIAASTASVVAATLLTAAGVASAEAGPSTPAPATSDAGTAAALGLDDKERLIVRDVVKDADGTTHTRYDRTYAGLPVLGGDFIVHRNASGTIKSVTHAAAQPIRISSLSAKVTSTAVDRAAVKAALAAGVDRPTTGGTDQEPRKVIWAAGSTPVLAYETVVHGSQKGGAPSRLHVITDATTGATLFEYQAIDNIADDTSQYNGKVDLVTTRAGAGYQLIDKSRGNHRVIDARNAEGRDGTLFTDADDTWGDGTPSNRQTAAVDAAYGFAQTNDFYKNVLGRDGIRNDGSAPTSYVHYGNKLDNAFYDDESYSIQYGDGDSGNNPWTQLDTVGHEFSHGVTAATARLVYAGESGGLNEATSDIFGTAIEFNAANPADPGDYFLAEKTNHFSAGKPLRYQDTPSRDGLSQDFWDATTKNKDPHYSSGVANHFFYLLAEGSGSKTINGVRHESATKDGSTLTGIGRDKAVKIWYKALSAYFTSTTDYKAARAGTVNAASDLYGANSSEVAAVKAAWTAVNVKG
ncbi:M4 family metallopeptidase [Streptomyces sp. NPDC006660]|uniref:M4 family metallopeptidase n=1 Tax=Streptomyces sp. NPDC006660 TaxID=3156901 RepID=UPI0033CAE157